MEQRRRSGSYNFRSSKKPKEETFLEIWQNFLDEISSGFFLAFKKLCISIFKFFVVSPCAKLRAEIFEEKNRRPNLEGLEKIRRHRKDYFIVVCLMLLVLVGTVIMYSLSPSRANFLNGTDGSKYGQYEFFFKQLLFYGIGIGVFILFAFLPITRIYRGSGWFLLIAFAACVMLFIFGLAKIPLADCKLGACRWFKFGSISVQPAEILKLAILISMSVFLGSKVSAGKINDFRETLLPLIFMIVAMMVVIAGLQKDLGTAVSGLAIFIAQIIISGIDRKKIITGLIAIVAMGVVFIAIAPHRLARVATFQNNDCSNLSSEEAGGDYHVCHAKIAIGSGGIFGVGIGNSVEATGYLPESINDSVFAIVGETFGFFGSVAILFVFFVLIYRMLKIVAYMTNPASRILVAGGCGWFASHIIMNVSAMIGLLPLTGITIPFLSYGGTSIIIMMAMLGIVFNISSYTSFAEVGDLIKEENENIGSRRRLGRSRNSSRGGF